MDIRVLGWRYENIRGGLRDVEIDLGAAVRWSLIQMPNGMGKTTTMALFRAAFSGAPLSVDLVKDLRSSDRAETGLFEVQLLIDGRQFRCQLRLDYRDGSHSYWTARSELRAGGLEEGWLLPTELRRLLTPEFVRLFVFDGELAKEIRAVGKERASLAIRTLYRLERLNDLSQQVARVVIEEQQRAAAVSTATELKGINRWQNQLKLLKAALSRLGVEHQRLKDSGKHLENRRVQMSEQINDHILQDDNLKKRKEALDTERAAIERRVFESTAEALRVFRSPAKLHPRILDRLHALGHKLNRLKLPKTISAEFFRELAEQPDCICGRPILSDERAAILQRAPMYLADDQIAIINKMKLALRESTATAAEYLTVTEALVASLRSLRQNKTAHDQLEVERVEAGDTELERLRNEIQVIAGDIRGVDNALEKISTRDAARQRTLGCTPENNLPLCDAETKRCDSKLQTATRTHVFARKAELVQRLLTQISTTALERLRERVRVATNAKLESLLPNERLSVARISGSLELESAMLANKSGVSEGQSLSVAYAFLTSLLSDAPYKLPFIVDSPAVSLDMEVRREVGNIVPELFDQMIVFVISSEREGFADAFYGRDSVGYFTLWHGAAEQTEVRKGLAFFQSFHVQDAAE